jgi:hypothetical protein
MILETSILVDARNGVRLSSSHCCDDSQLFKLFKEFKSFKSPSAFLPRDAGEDEGGGLIVFNGLNVLNYFRDRVNVAKELTANCAS